MAHDDIRTLSELAVALSDDKRFADFQLTARGDGFIELRVGEGGVILAEARLAKDRAKIEPHLVGSEAGSTFLIIVGADDEFAGVEAVRDRYELAVVSLPISRARLYVTLKNYFDLIALRRRAAEGGRYRDEIGELVAISRALSSERDISKLLGLILEKSRYITSADAGSVYTVEGRSLNPRERTLRFVVSQNDSVKIDFREFTLPVDEKSIVGRSVIERQVMNIPNLYALDEPGTNPWGFKHDKT